MGRVKGTQILGVVKALRAQRERVQPLLAPHLRRYLDERILAASWYSDADFRDLTLLLGRFIAPQVDGNVWRALGVMGAERDFAGVYAAMVRQGDPEWTVRHMPDGWRQYRDSGALSVEELRAGFAELFVRAYPVMCPELAEVNAGYFEGTLRAARAEQARVDVVEHDERSARWRLYWA